MFANVFFDDKKDDCDVIEISEYVIQNIDNIMTEFFAWMFNKHTDHEYWVIVDGEKRCCNYDTEALISWLRKYKDSEAAIVKRHAISIDYRLPEIVL
jgi:transcription elongation factor GreA-like protein